MTSRSDDPTSAPDSAGLTPPAPNLQALQGAARAGATGAQVEALLAAEDPAAVQALLGSLAGRWPLLASPRQSSAHKNQLLAQLLSRGSRPVTEMVTAVVVNRYSEQLGDALDDPTPEQVWSATDVVVQTVPLNPLTLALVDLVADEVNAAAGIRRVLAEHPAFNELRVAASTA